MKLKTEFIQRFFNLNPRICIYDLDGTIIDSSHRARHDQNGILDLEHWHCKLKNSPQSKGLTKYQKVL